MKRFSPRKVVPWLLAVALAVFAAYRLKFRPMPVTAHLAVAGDIRGEVMGTGTLEARVKTIISPRIQERLAEVLVDQGDAVKAGQLLARLDNAESAQQVAIAEATLAAARATVERVRADEARAQAVLRQTRLDHRRLTELLAGKVAAQADFDKTVEAQHVAEADLQRAQAAIVEAESQVFAAEKSLLYRKEQLAFTEVRSPYDGLVVRRDRDPGGVVVPGGSLLQLIATNEIWVSAWVDETAIASLAPGQPARVVFRSEAAKSYAGEVARLGREADRETREFLVDVRVKMLPRNWAVGQRAEVYIETGRKDSALFLPLQFVSWRAGKPGAFVNEGGRARWREFKPGLRGVDVVEVLEGLSAGDTVCKPRELKQVLADGQRIAVP